ncbi:MAG: nuclear transport factor 2 family protein [Labedaea sp.]
MNTNELVERYIATWNERDAGARRAAIKEIWLDEGRLTDPLVVADGVEAIDATIAGVQERFPQFGVRLAGAVDAHHNLARFTWEMGQDGAEAVVVGFDVAVLSEDGRLREVHGFLDKVPTS